MFKQLPENIRQILNSTIPLFVVIVLFVFVGKFGFSQITSVRQKITQGQKDGTVLSQKLDLLSSISDIAANGATVSSIAVPANNSSLAVIAQLKILGIKNGVIVTGVKAAGEVKDESGLSRSDIVLEATGGRSNIIAFLKGISSFAPLAVVDKIKLNEVGGTVRANISVKAFWSEFPTKLPTTTEPITDLTADERKILQELSALTQPTFVEIPASSGTGRSDPFSP